MPRDPGWLERQLRQAIVTVQSWTPGRRELFVCRGKHTFGPSLAITATQELQVCSGCDRQRIKPRWADDWLMVARGAEVPWAATSRMPAPARCSGGPAEEPARRHL